MSASPVLVFIFGVVDVFIGYHVCKFGMRLLYGGFHDIAAVAGHYTCSCDYPSKGNPSAGISPNYKPTESNEGKGPTNKTYYTEESNCELLQPILSE